MDRGGDRPLVWAIHDGKAGMISQVIGLAEALGWPFIEKRLVIRTPWSHLIPQLWFRPFWALDPSGATLAPPWPDLIIACGRNTVAVAHAVKRRSGGRSFWVQIQDPRFARSAADLIIVPAHDATSGGNVFPTLGAVHRVTAERLAAMARSFASQFAALPRPLVAVLIGGDNGAYRLTAERFSAFCDQLVALAGKGFGIAVTPSRRTAPERLALLQAKLKGSGVYIWDGAGENPYFAMLGAADAIIVTADSVSMISEAAATGKPVYIAELDGGSAKFTRFHEAMRAAGITRPFRGLIETWRYAPPDDTAHAAAEIRRRMKLA